MTDSLWRDVDVARVLGQKDAIITAQIKEAERLVAENTRLQAEVTALEVLGGQYYHALSACMWRLVHAGMDIPDNAHAMLPGIRSAQGDVAKEAVKPGLRYRRGWGGWASNDQ